MIRKIKLILVIVAMVLVLWFIFKIKKLKPEVENMMKREFGIAKKVFAFRDLIHSTFEIENPNKPIYGDEFRKTEVKRNNVKRRGRDKVRRSGSKTSKYKREEKCRKVLEDYYDDYFPTVRPKFLKNPKTGYPLELDGYNAALNLAFEHNGHQHSEYPNSFHKTKQQFLNQQERDRYKIRRCTELGIKLIIIPHTIPYRDIEDFILSKIP